MTFFALPGYDVIQLLGAGSTGEVWLARDDATGDLVALKRLLLPSDPAVRARLRREAAALVAVTHPHVVRIRELVDAGDEVVLVLDYAARGSLATLLTSRGRLSPGEVVTLGVPLCQGLAGITMAGVVHGDISARNVLFTATGQPLLSECALAQIVDGNSPHVQAAGARCPAVLAGAAPGPATDVYALAAVCLAALGDDHRGRVSSMREGALRRVLGSAMAPEPGERPSAEELSVALFDACPPEPISFEPVVFTEPPTAARVTRAREPGRAGRRRRRASAQSRLAATLSVAGAEHRLRSLIGAALLVLAGLLAIRLGAAGAASDAEISRGSAEHRLASSAPSTGRSVRWADVLRGLDTTRSAAFAHADPARLAEVYAPASPALRRDRQLLAELVASGTKARDVRLDLRSVEVREGGADRVVLKVTDVMPPYELIGEGGSRGVTQRGRPMARWLVTLVHGTDGWRVYDVVRG